MSSRIACLSAFSVLAFLAFTRQAHADGWTGPSYVLVPGSKVFYDSFPDAQASLGQTPPTSTASVVSPGFAARAAAAYDAIFTYTGTPIQWPLYINEAGSISGNASPGPDDGGANSYVTFAPNGGLSASTQPSYSLATPAPTLTNGYKIKFIGAAGNTVSVRISVSAHAIVGSEVSSGSANSTATGSAAIGGP